MIGVVAEVTVKEGAQAEFESVAKELVAAVNANEPGCLYYRLFKVRETSAAYVFMEQYRDQEAVDAHRASDHFRRLGKAMGAFMEGAPNVKRMDIME